MRHEQIAANITLFGSIVAPKRQIKAVEETVKIHAPLPWRAWIGFALIAIVGSALYGGSLAIAIPQIDLIKGALWLTLSAGFAWLIFGPGLVWLSKKPLLTCAHACLVTMAYGEGVLLVGALLNVVIARSGLKPPFSIAFNFGWVALSNLVMLAALCLQLKTISVPLWKSLLGWFLLLDGSGALFFWLLSLVFLKR